jgi:hypothetical protein
MSFGLDDFFSVCNNGKTRSCKKFYLRYVSYVTYIIVIIIYIYIYDYGI